MNYQEIDITLFSIRRHIAKIEDETTKASLDLLISHLEDQIGVNATVIAVDVMPSFAELMAPIFKTLDEIKELEEKKDEIPF